MNPDGARQSRLDAFRPARESTPAQTVAEPAPAAAAPAPERDKTTGPIPSVTEADRARLQRAALDGLAAVGFESPRVKLELKPHSALRASLSQDRAGKIQPGERLTLELTDGYALAPERAVAGLVAGLGLGVLRRRKQNELARMLIEYHDLWQRSRAGRDLQSRIRRQRARKQGRGPHGTAHNLETIRDRLNTRFFAGRLEAVELTWSSREGYNVLGHHDGDLDTIVINRCLDHADIPETLVAYILYHELLHHTLGIQEVPGGRRSLHPPSFRRRERRFPKWSIADEYLKEMCTRRRPIPYRRAKEDWCVLWDETWHKAPAMKSQETPVATAPRDHRQREEEAP